MGIFVGSCRQANACKHLALPTLTAFYTAFYHFSFVSSWLRQALLACLAGVQCAPWVSGSGQAVWDRETGLVPRLHRSRLVGRAALA